VDKAAAVLPEKHGVDAWIQEQSVDYSVALLLSVSRSAYYAWTKAVESRKVKRDKELKTVPFIDLYSRQIVGWSMAERMKTKLVNDALIMAIWKRKPQKGLLWHTDRGSQYASDSHRKLLKQHGITQSMSRKGNCWDNAVSESFFHTLKTECVNHENYPTREAAKKSIFDYIEVFYNRQRLHSNNGYLSPVEFERQLKSA